MVTPIRASRTRAVGRRKAAETAPILSKAVTDRTDLLVELTDHCGVAKRLAEDMGEDFLAYLLSMVIEEGQTAMRRATLGIAVPAKKRHLPKRVS